MTDQERARKFINQKRRERYKNNPEREKKNRLRSYVNVLVREGVLVALQGTESDKPVPRTIGGHAVYILKEGAIA